LSVITEKADEEEERQFSEIHEPGGNGNKWPLTSVRAFSSTETGAK
jgi:hypothetical protein